MPAAASHRKQAQRKFDSGRDTDTAVNLEDGSGFSIDEDDEDKDDHDNYGDDDGDYSTDASYVETNVLLGYVEEGSGDGLRGEDSDAGVGSGGDGSGSFLGGRPIWLSNNDQKSKHDNVADSSDKNENPSPPSAHLACCSVCGNYMSLLLQLNANLPDRFPGHERRLYVFACRRKACQRKEGCVGVVRGVRVDYEDSGSGELKTKDGDEMVGVVSGGDDDSRRATKKEQQEVSSTKQRRLGDTLFGVSAESGNGSGGSMAESRNPFSLNSKSQIGMSGNGNPFSMKAGTPNVASTSTSASKPIPSSRLNVSAADTTKPHKTDHTTDLPERFKAAVRISDDNSAATSTNTTTTTTTTTIITSTTTATTATTEPNPKPNAQPHDPWPPRSAFPTLYPKSSLEADYETLDKMTTSDGGDLLKNLKIPAEDAMQIDDDNDNDKIVPDAGANSNEKQIFESTLDKTFQRFADRLAQNPEQVLRYEFGGKPLLYASDNCKDGSDGNGGGGGGGDEVARMFMKSSSLSRTTEGSASNSSGNGSGKVKGMGGGNRKYGVGGGGSSSIDSVIPGPATAIAGAGVAAIAGKKERPLPSCPNCNAPRVFEMQLTPHAIEILEDGEATAASGIGSGLDGMSWGTIIVAVCLADCRPVGVDIGQVGYLKEWVGVQWEEEVEEVKK